MKKVVIAAISVFILLAFIVSTIAYYFYIRISNGYIDERIEGTVIVNNVETSKVLSSLMEYNIDIMNKFYEDNSELTLSELDSKIENVDGLLYCEDVRFAKMNYIVEMDKKTCLSIETSTDIYTFNDTYASSNFIYEKFSVIDFNEAFNLNLVNKDNIIIRLTDEIVAIVAGKPFFDPIIQKNREYDPQSFLINKNGYVYYSTLENAKKHFYSNYVTTSSTKMSIDELLVEVANNDTYASDLFRVNKENCYLTFSKISLDGQSEEFYLVSVFYKDKLEKFESSMIIPLAIMFFVIVFAIIIGMGMIFTIIIIKNADIQSSRLRLMYKKPYVMRVNKKGKIKYRNLQMSNLNIDWKKYRNISDFKLLDSNDDILTNIKMNKSITISLENLNNETIILYMICVKNSITSYLIGENVTYQYQKALSMKYEYMYDKVTKLPKSEFLEEKLQEIIDVSEKKSREEINFYNALMYLSIDDIFKYENIFGEKITDKIVIAFVEKISNNSSENIKLYYIRKGIFALLFCDIDNYNIPIKWFNDFKSILKKPIEIYVNKLNLKTQAGIFNIDVNLFNDLTPKKVIENVEMAFNYANSLYSVDLMVYNISISTLVKRDQIMEEDLKKAIDNKELLVHIQPQYNMTTKKIVGFEALTRWNNPKYKTDSPQHFIELAEKNNLIIPIGLEIANQAFSIAKRLENENITISINVSPAQFVQDGFVSELISLAEKYQVNPSLIALEVTETFLIENFSVTLEKIKVLKKYGFRIHLDDFGTGYSSLLYLKDIPIDCIKIDKGFIKHVSTDKNTRIIVSKIISLASSLGLEVIAEGVEDEKQSQFLAKSGCEIIQGWMISKALVFEDALKLIEEYNSSKKNKNNSKVKEVNEDVISSELE